DTMRQRDEDPNVCSYGVCGKDNHKDGKDGRDGKDGHDCGCDSSGSGGAGGFQLGVQKADTEQWAGALSVSKQNAVNGNAPVNIRSEERRVGKSWRDLSLK